MADGGNTYAWDAEYQVKTVAGVTYTYDGDGKRVAKSTGKLYWSGTGRNSLAESDGSGNVTDEFAFFGDKRIAKRNSLGNVYYYIADHLATSRVIADAGGVPCYDADYYPFGGEAVYLNTCPQNYKFTGKERDSESGLDYFGVRYYSSNVGRFSSPDSIANDWEFESPQSWNRYAYARNNPLIYLDPDGAAVELIGDTDAERQQALQQLQKDVADKDAASRLYINEVKDGDKTRYFVGIKGDVGSFMKLSDTAHDLANLVEHKQVVEFGLTNQNLAKYGGAVTYEKGEVGNQNVRVLVNPRQAESVGDSNLRSTILGMTRFAGQSGKDPWQIRAMTQAIAHWHEFGHAWGSINGRPAPRSNAEALAWENRMRKQVYGPLGPNNAPRERH